ncbi:GTP 3',8-cyclase MoaA [Romboutsia sp.]|uniref:GTP 3',8-cyclase MoaA n=1 Tax=Romboutsia sp. TaxID=1965302 RepID=UPI003F361179
MKDKFGRNINYARISLTDKCNLRCVYCMPSDVKFEKNYMNDELSFEDYKFIIKGLSELGITKVRFTGGEPLLYPYLKELIKFTYEECNIKDVAITTNGIGLAEKARELKAVGLKKVNISLDSLKSYKYKSITRGGDIKHALNAITTCVKLGLNVKVNCVIINEFNDDEIEDFMLMTNFYPIDVRFIELMPLGEGQKLYQKGYFNIREFIENIDGIYKLNSNENSTADYYEYRTSKGKIGIITPLGCSFCKNCNRIRITSNGKIKLCLHSREEIDIKYYLNRPMMFREIMKEIILNKPEKHHLNENLSSDTNRCMYEIGG